MANFKASFLNNMLNRFINKVSIHIRPRALVAAFSFLLMFVLSSLNVPTSRAATNIQVGVQFHAMWSTYTDSQRITVLDKMAAAHVQWVRIDMDWSWFEHDGKGIIDSANVTLADSIVNAAQARGIKVLVVVKGSPLWANNNQPSNVPPTNPVDYADFMSYMSTHFQGRVAAWQLWNEPNLAPFWSTTSPVTYAALVRATYPKIKAADPQAQVVIGGVSQNNDAWLASMYDAGVSNAYDVLATHPYQGPANGVPELPDDGNPWIMNHISAVRNLMVARGDAAKPIWAAEFGWSSHANNGSEQPWELGVSESQQAEYIVRTLEMFTANHPYVTNMFWYNERNKTTGSPQEDNYGLLYSNLTEKLVYVALKNYLTGVVPPVLKPDLIITDVSWAPTSPASGNQVKFTAVAKNIGTATIPNGTVVGVSFLVDGIQVSWGAYTTTGLAPGASMSVAATGGPNGNSLNWIATGGNHTVTVIGDDVNRFSESNESNNNYSEPITVLGGDVVAPVAKITSPVDGSRVSQTASVKASATDNVGVKKIEIYIDGQLKATANSSSITYSWKNISAGQHTIVAKAYDNAGNVGSKTIHVTR